MFGEWDMVDALLYSTTGPIPVEQQPSDEEVSHGIIPIIILSVCVINIIIITFLQSGKSAFQYICAGGNLDRVKTMISKGADLAHVDRVSWYNYTVQSYQDMA